MQPTYDQLRLSLDLALMLLFPLEPPDSRAVSDEFVALSAVSCDLVDDAVMKVINTVLSTKISYYSNHLYNGI